MFGEETSRDGSQDGFRVEEGLTNSMSRIRPAGQEPSVHQNVVPHPAQRNDLQVRANMHGHIKWSLNAGRTCPTKIEFRVFKSMFMFSDSAGNDDNRPIQHESLSNM
uniref:Uncharacterized protein n=1 Tax=Ascaris lumbricoides TaxID=6252 RepID=A0A0M3HU36_ASCLU